MTKINQSREFTKQEEYKLTHNRSASISDHVEAVLTVNDWLYYSDVNSRNENVNVLVLDTNDGLYSSISATFIREFLDISAAFDLPVTVNVIGGKTKAGRDFVTCELA